eukprot:513498_1
MMTTVNYTAFEMPLYHVKHLVFGYIRLLNYKCAQYSLFQSIKSLIFSYTRFDLDTEFNPSITFNNNDLHTEYNPSITFNNNGHKYEFINATINTKDIQTCNTLTIHCFGDMRIENLCVTSTDSYAKPTEINI